MKTNSKTQRGYSLIELLLVVAIIGIIAAISVTYILHARQAARSASAVASLRTIYSAEVSYKNSSGAFGTLAQLGAAGFLKDPSLTAETKSGYKFSVNLNDPAIGDARQYFSATASPTEQPGMWLHYFVDATGVIRSKVGSAPTRTDAPIR